MKRAVWLLGLVCGCGPAPGDVPTDAGLDVSSPDARPAGTPRMIAPLSTSFVTSRRPTLHWTPAADVTVTLCRDADCVDVITSFDASGDHGSPPADLEQGTVFWRVCSQGMCPEFTWSFAVPRRSAPHDTSWGARPDLDHDGDCDIVVGQPYAAGLVAAYASTSDGPMLIGYLGGLWPPSIMRPGSFGRSVAMAGNVLGGPNTAILVGAVGHAYVSYNFGNAQPDREIPTNSTDEFGSAVAGAGDVDGDGYADLLIGTATLSRGGVVAMLYYGGDSSSTAGSEIPLYLGEGSGYGVPSMRETERFSAALSSGGDVNGDGLADVVIGAPGTDRAYVYLGESTRPPSREPIVLQGPDGSHFGAAVGCAGDVNGDGLSDVIVGAPLADRAFIYLGDAAMGLTSDPVELSVAGLEAADFGVSVSGAGDVDGDGYGDVVVGAPAAELSFGRAYVFSGSVAGLAATPSATLAGTDASGADFARSVAGVGDLDGDGFDDVVVGVPGAPPEQRGAVDVFRGAAGGAQTVRAWRLEGHDMGYGQFGASIARAL